MELPPYELITTQSAWDACLARLRQEPRMSVDLEANSLYAYREKICLIQISIPDHDFIVDPLAGFDFSGLGAVLADSRVEKVFHASDYDLFLLKTGPGWEVSNLFDTMWAARILGYTKMGLAGFLKDFFDIDMAKTHQKADWAARPLPEARLVYAQCDTHYLLRLRDALSARLEAQGCMEEALEIMANASRVMPMDRSFDPEGFWALTGTKRLSPKSLAVLRALYQFREREAQRRDVPVFKVLSSELLVKVAERAPQSLEELHQVDGLSRKLADRMGERILRAVETGCQSKPPQPRERKHRTDAGASDRYKALFAWRKETALRRGVESDVIMTRETMWDIAERFPKDVDALRGVVTLGPCRRALYGEAVLRTLVGKTSAEQA